MLFQSKTHDLDFNAIVSKFDLDLSKIKVIAYYDKKFMKQVMRARVEMAMTFLVSEKMYKKIMGKRDANTSAKLAGNYYANYMIALKELLKADLEPKTPYFFKQTESLEMNFNFGYRDAILQYCESKRVIPPTLKLVK